MQPTKRGQTPRGIVTPELQGNGKAEKFLHRIEASYARHVDRVREPYLSVSIQLAKYVYEKKLIKPFQAYLALKFHSRSGKIVVDQAAEIIRQTLGHSDTRQATKHLQKCLAMNWISQGHAFFYIRSFERLQSEFSTTSRTAAVLRYSDIRNIREWTLAHFAASRYRHFDRVRKKGRANQGRKASGRQCSTSIISDEFRMSYSAAHYLKQRAKKQGYFTTRNQAERTNIHPADIQQARKFLNDPALFIKSGIVFRRLPDVFRFNLDAPGKLRLIHFTRRPKYACN